MPRQRYDQFTAFNNLPKLNRGSVENFAFGGRIVKGSRPYGFVPAGSKVGDPGILPSGAGYAVAWAPSSKQVLVGHVNSPYLAMYGFDGSLFTKHTNPINVAFPGAVLGIAYNPVTDHCAFAHQGSPYLTVATVNAGGTTMTKLANPATLPPAECWSVSWSPNGKFLAVAHLVSPYVSVYSFDGTTLTKLADPANLPTGSGYSVDWSPDGRFLAVGFSGSPYIHVYRFDGATLTKVANPTVLPNGTVRALAWSPDGRWLHAVNEGATPWNDLYLFEGGIFQTRIAGPVVSAACYGTSWSPCGRYMAIASGPTPVFTVGQFDGYEIVPATQKYPFNAPPALCRATGWSQDGKYLAAVHESSPYLSLYNSDSGTSNPGGLIDLEAPSNVS